MLPVTRKMRANRRPAAFAKEPSDIDLAVDRLCERLCVCACLKPAGLRTPSAPCNLATCYSTVTSPLCEADMYEKNSGRDFYVTAHEGQASGIENPGRPPTTTYNVEKPAGPRPAGPARTTQQLTPEYPRERSPCRERRRGVVARWEVVRAACRLTAPVCSGTKGWAATDMGSKETDEEPQKTVVAICCAAEAATPSWQLERPKAM